MKAIDFWRKEADKMRNTSNITDTKAVTDTSHLSPEREEEREKEPYQDPDFFSWAYVIYSKPTNPLNSLLGIPPKITLGVPRYFQALKNKEMGLECNATTIMYFLQSLGLIPARITRKQFEYLFTSLEGTSKQPSFVKFPDGNSLPLTPVDAFDGILNTNQLRGIENYFGVSPSYYENGVFKESIGNAIRLLEKIVNRFIDITQSPPNTIIQDYYTPLAKKLVESKIRQDYIIDMYSYLEKNTIEPRYFENGGSIFVGLEYHYPFPETDGISHYALVTGKPDDDGKEVFSIVDNGQNFTYYIHGIDDAFHRQARLIVPACPQKHINLALKNGVKIQEDTVSTELHSGTGLFSEVYYNIKAPIYSIRKKFAIGIDPKFLTQ